MVAGFLGLAMLVYTPTTYPGQETAQEVRPGLELARSRALARACPVAAVGCSTAALATKTERYDHRVLRLDHRLLCLFHLPWPWGQWERPP